MQRLVWFLFLIFTRVLMCMDASLASNKAERQRPTLFERRAFAFKAAKREHSLIKAFVDAKVPLPSNWESFIHYSLKSMENIERIPGEGFGVERVQQKVVHSAHVMNAHVLLFSIILQKRLLLYKDILQDTSLIQAICDNNQKDIEAILQTRCFLYLMPCDTTQKLQDIYMFLKTRLDRHDNIYRLNVSSHATVACQPVAVIAKLQSTNQVPADTTWSILPFFNEENLPGSEKEVLDSFLNRCERDYNRKPRMF